MRGDLILYKSTGKWYERAISLATKGPFVHVAIDMSDACVLAASTHGIEYDVRPPIDAMHSLVSIVSCTKQEERLRAIKWAIAQIGKEYGWLDIVYQGIKFLWPSNPLRFGIKGHFDCSDFATRYLMLCGVELPPEYQDAYTVTPNDLARLFGLLGPTGQVLGEGQP